MLDEEVLDGQWEAVGCLQGWLVAIWGLIVLGLVGLPGLAVHQQTGT